MDKMSEAISSPIKISVLFYIYLFTCDHAHACGTCAGASPPSKWDDSKILRAFGFPKFLVFHTISRISINFPIPVFSHQFMISFWVLTVHFSLRFDLSFIKPQCLKNVTTNPKIIKLCAFWSQLWNPLWLIQSGEFGHGAYLIWILVVIFIWSEVN